MWAVICARAGDLSAGLRDIAGRPLLVRQLQWLRDNRIAQVAVEVCAGPHAAEFAPLLIGNDPLLDGCLVLPSAAPLGARALALRAGIPAHELLLVLPGDLLVGGSLPSPCLEGRYQLRPLAERAREPLALCVIGGEGPPPAARTLTAWAMQIATPAAAHEASCAVLMGRAPGVLVHAAEVRHGVWLGRGAQIARQAQLQPPVLVGAEARVLAGAALGPEAILGRRSVVERGARVASASIGDDVWVGEHSELRGVLVQGARVESFADGTAHYSDDPLQLAPRGARPGAALGGRLLALGLLAVLLLPWLLLAARARLRGRPALSHRQTSAGSLRLGGLESRLDCVPPLLDVLHGRRDLLGNTDPELLDQLSSWTPARVAALEVGDLLAPGAGRDTRLRMLHWYRWHKRPGLDLQLGVRALLRLAR